MIMLDVLNFDSFARVWKNKLRSVKAENQVEIYQTLSILAKEINPSVFQMQMKNFIQLWLPRESDFVKYFVQTYQNRAGIYIP